MAAAKTARPMSSPISVPDKSTKSLRRKSILKNSNLYSSSLDSSDITPASSPDCTERVRRVSQVRFSDELQSDVKMQALYAAHKQRKNSAASVKSSSSNGKVKSALKVTSSRARYQDQEESDSDSLNDDVDADDDSGHDSEPYDYDMSSSLPVLHISATMSHEAQYAVLKAYEDDLCARVEKLLPDVASQLMRCRTPDNRDGSADDEQGELDFDDDECRKAPLMTPSNELRVALRLTQAMDTLSAVRDAAIEAENCKSTKSKSKLKSAEMSKDSLRKLEKWCHSLKNTLDGLKVNSSAET